MDKKVTIRELKGWPHALTDANGKSFRLLPYEKKSIDKALVSEDMRIAEKMGYVAILVEEPKTAPAVENHSKEQDVVAPAPATAPNQQKQGGKK